MIREIMHQLGQLFTWLVIIAPWEQGIRVRLGKHARLLEPGWYLRVPFIDRIYRQSVRERFGIARAITTSTKDGHTLTVSGSFSYRIVDLMRLYQTLHDADDTLEAKFLGELSSFIVTRDLADCSPEALAGIMQSVDASQYGIEVTAAFINNFCRVRTYRMITGDFQQWRGGGLNTIMADGERHQ